VEIIGDRNAGFVVGLADPLFLPFTGKPLSLSRVLVLGREGESGGEREMERESMCERGRG
jgi:hypothetical protein